MLNGTWSLITSSVEVITGARRMTLRIHRLLQPGNLEISESDRRRLLGLQKRVECLVQPLNFLVLWSKQQNSCVQQAVLSAQELLFDVCRYIDQFDRSCAIPSAQPPSINSDLLEWYLRELDFACSSVSMGVSIACASDARPRLAAAECCAEVRGRRPGAAQDAAGAGGVSLSALLRASQRIQGMLGRSGDLCACPGRLYAREERPPSPWQARAALPEEGRGGGAVGGTGSPLDGAGEGEGGEWSAVLSLATLKIVAALDRKGRRYSLCVESRLPLGPAEEPRPMQPGAAPEEEAWRGGVGLNASGFLEFPIEAALGAQLLTTGSLALPMEPTRCSRDLGIDSLALVWDHDGEEPLQPQRAAAAEFPDAELLHEASAECVAWARSGCGGASPSAARRAASRHAFVFDVARGSAADLRSGEPEITLSPLDALYLARLCALDDVYQQPHAQEGEGAACPPHMLASDEVLGGWLLQDGAVGRRPGTPGAAEAAGVRGAPPAGGPARRP